MRKVALVGMVLLLAIPTSLDAANLLRLRIAHERVGNRPEQTITVVFWPEPGDRALHLIAADADHERISSVRLYGIESARVHTFVWHLPPNVLHDEGLEPYTVTAVVLDRDGATTASAQTRFYVY